MAMVIELGKWQETAWAYVHTNFTQQEPWLRSQGIKFSFFLPGGDSVTHCSTMPPLKFTFKKRNMSKLLFSYSAGGQLCICYWADGSVLVHRGSAIGGHCSLTCSALPPVWHNGV